ncbi:type II toxin-antitoxin system VapC family toxin [Patulibacter americanus]|uniref:type II toxin-antitoxin system VapC family toxin n=1 Tax=Patulibacter americanus TaxID=588672 RepID=UPI0003B70765|nr:PIN domain-containing protein [Patulibacter americanus]
MGVVVFDSDVLIGFVDPEDAHHTDAVAWIREATRPQTERWISAVNYSELLIGPMRRGMHEHVKAMLGGLSIATAPVDTQLAERAAVVRARTNLKLPDAYALATAIDLEHRGRTDVRLATFDKRVLKAHADLHA